MVKEPSSVGVRVHGGRTRRRRRSGEQEDSMKRAQGRGTAVSFSREIASQISRENYPIVCRGRPGRRRRRRLPPPPTRPTSSRLPRRPRISSLGYIIGFLFHVFIPGADPNPRQHQRQRQRARGYLSTPTG